MMLGRKVKTLLFTKTVNVKNTKRNYLLDYIIQIIKEIISMKFYRK